MTDFDVIISGGGPVGMGLAIELGQRGHSVAVVERHPTPQRVPKGQNLTQRTMESLHFWGAEQAVRAIRPLPPEVGIGGMTTYGTLLSPWHYDWLQREAVRDYYLTDNERLPQYLTEEVLRARAAEIGSITRFYGWTGGRATDHGDRVTLDISETAGEGTRSLTGRYLVGCDGARSPIREQAGITETRREHDKLMVLLVFRAPQLHELLKRYPGKAFWNVLHPDLKGYWLFFGRVDADTSFFFHAPVPADTTRDNFDFADFVQRAVGEAFALDFDYIGFWDLRIAIADAYGAGNIFIAGDAAHSHPPYGAFGINTGFEDARNLGWKLSAALQGWAGAGLLQSYDAERRPVFASTAGDFIENFIAADREFLDSHDPDRDPAAFEAEWARRSRGSSDEVFAYEPNYEGSPLIGGPGAPSARGRHEHRARPGHHLSPQPLSDGCNLFDAVGLGFTLISLGTDGVAAAFESEAKARGIPLTVIRDMPDGPRAAWQAPSILLRPDQFVAWCTDAGQGTAAIDAGAILDRATGRDG